MNTCGLFVCPVCKSGLAKNGGSYRCEQGHCFDISAQGHVNLLLANRMNSHAPGDDKDMVAARARFLAKRYYAPLQEAIGALVADFAPQNAAVLDLGCGEGYYTSGVCEALASAGKRGRVAGVDISKSAAKLAAKLAAKQCPSAEIAVASVFPLPVANASCDIVLNCFSPLCLAEILRVLRTG
ncbi:MAG: methyltransferase domain-containing protein, partial [Oscillospiraceae bacterium]|nr:methyltransferase domain-containing protein [Oscillospiraceae bacterium]